MVGTLTLSEKSFLVVKSHRQLSFIGCLRAFNAHSGTSSPTSKFRYFTDISYFLVIAVLFLFSFFFCFYLGFELLYKQHLALQLMHLVVWFILSPLILHKYRTTMSTPGPFEEEAFSPQRCANIHNRLLQHAAVNNPSAVIERNLISKFLEVAPEFAEIPHLESLPLYSFFSLLDTTSLPHGQVAPLTPEIYEPDPTAFWSEGFSHEPGIILLYGQNNGDSPMDGGLFLDLQTCKAVWHWNSGPFPAPEKWVLLETALQYQLDKWESGKYYWDAVTKSLATKRWIERDITNALAAWDSLLLTIEAKMQQGGQRVHSRLEPLEAESMSSFQIGSFAKTFLSRA